MSSGYWLFAMMIIPVAAGIFQWIKFKTIDVLEMIISIVCAGLVCAGILTLSNYFSQRSYETYSGYAMECVYTPKWEAEWTEMETYTDSKGNSQTRMVTRHETHYPKWTILTTIGEFDVHEDVYQEIAGKFGYDSRRGYRPDYDSGDKNDYYSLIPEKYLAHYPVSKSVSWVNKYKNTDSIVVGEPMTDQEATKLNLPKYPHTTNIFSSKRLVGGVDGITTLQWDQLNNNVGFRDKCNLILVNLGSDSGLERAVNLKRYWQNGEKNDLVLCYGGSGENKWSYVFGWSKSELIKQNLQTLLLDNPITPDLLTKFDEEIHRNFQPYEWEEVEVRTKGVPTWGIITAFIVMLLTQGGLYYYFHTHQTMN